MFVAANLTPTYAVAVGGFTFPGYSALYAVIINLVVTAILTPPINLLSARPRDETIAAEYRAPV
jgi:SSS family solute:Na+ symporter